VQEVHPGAVDGGRELRVGVDPGFGGPPVVALPPVLDSARTVATGTPSPAAPPRGSGAQRTRSSRSRRSTSSASGTAMVNGRIAVSSLICLAPSDSAVIDRSEPPAAASTRHQL
jgi:hypothetical protein